MSQKDQQNDSTTSSSSVKVALDKKLATEQRLCHMVKRADFDGYGFNLHSEKGKPGQYIGKVDEKSPAETSGLRQGDRIIEVNGVNIGLETHKQVVQRIKAIENEVRLLVIDPDVESRIRQEHEKTDETAAMMMTATSTTATSATPSPTSSMKNNNSSQSVKADDQSNNNSINASNNSRNSISTVSSIESSSNGGSGGDATLTASPSPTMTAGGKSSMETAANGTNSSNGVAKSSAMVTSSSSTASASGTGLNLKMTAAEMRAKLQARKKYDPKNDTVDLRKKFDIIQKL